MMRTLMTTEWHVTAVAAIWRRWRTTNWSAATAGRLVVIVVLNQMLLVMIWITRRWLMMLINADGSLITTDGDVQIIRWILLMLERWRTSRRIISRMMMMILMMQMIIATEIGWRWCACVVRLMTDEVHWFVFNNRHSVGCCCRFGRHWISRRPIVRCRALLFSHINFIKIIKSQQDISTTHKYVTK